MVTVEAKSLQLALLKAAGQLSITQSDLGYKIIKENYGIFGLFGKKVCIEAWVVKKSQRRRSSAAPSPHPMHAAAAPRRGEREAAREVEAKTPLTAEELRSLKAEIKEFCQGLIQQISGATCRVDVSEEDTRLVLAVHDDAINAELAKNMKFIEAIEHLIRKKPKNLHQELPFRIYVDINGVRQYRQDELATLAKDLSDKVFENKRPIVLNYRSSYDRKIIHMALDKDERVYTKSIGNGPNRKLMILPVQAGKQEMSAR